MAAIGGLIGLGLTLAPGTSIGAGDAAAQQDPEGSIVLNKQGSFFVGGQTENTGPNSDITIDQMYVQYQIPEGVGQHLPVVMIHGCCLSGKSWEETPDGRIGWNTYFLLRHHPVYVVDQVSRARSGFDATVFSQVRSGALPPSSLPAVLQVSHQASWSIFRFGLSFGQPFPKGQFPIEAVEGLYQQEIPDLNALLPTANPTYANLSALAARLNGAILMGHSESGFFPEFAALAGATGIKGLVTIEHNCNTLTDDQIAALAKIPTLIVFGDFIELFPQWVTANANCHAYADRITAAGGDVTFVHLPDLGIYGNSHMMMLDKNNLQVADVILNWIEQHVEGH
jgi:pimeloyl-ACP methyl ester carboxylesterase